MSYQINLQEDQSQLAALIARVEAGEEVVITRADKPIARLIPYAPTKGPRRLGEAKGLVEIRADFDDMPADFTAHFS
jgi:prevent-host-death family protein